MAPRVDPEVVLGLIELADLAGLKKFIPADFDWRSRGAHLLQFTILQSWNAETDKIPHYLKIAEWMISKGADPAQEVSHSRSDAVPLGPTAYSKIFYMLKGAGDNTKYLQQLLLILSGSTAQKRETVEVDRAVLQRWESIRNKADTHNVTFETAEGPVTAHDAVLMVASPVLTAMLESTMAEGTSKCIRVSDSSAAAVALFLDMVYMSATDSDLQYKTVLGALDLSHRWEVRSVVRVFEDILQDMLTTSNFPEIAEAAALKDLEGLKEACAKFAETDDGVKALVPGLA